MAREPKPRSEKGPRRTSPADATPAAAATGPSTSGAREASPRDRVVDGLLRLAAERRWDEIELPDIAAAADLTLSELRDLFPSKGAILAGYSRRLDKIVLDGTTGDLEGESVRERLFDVLMRRLDAMAPHKDALRSIARDIRTDPVALAALNQVALNSQRYMLAAAGIKTEGPLGAVKLQGAVLLFARVLETWFDDDDPGLSRTMAVLDRELARAGRTISLLTDAYRITTPFRALFERVAEGPRRFRERARREEAPGYDDPDEDYAPAI